MTDTIEADLPGSELVIVKGGDCVRDVVMEIRLQGRSVQYKPYELYQEGCAKDEYEERVYELVNKLTDSTASD